MEQTCGYISMAHGWDIGYRRTTMNNVLCVLHVHLSLCSFNFFGYIFECVIVDATAAAAILWRRPSCGGGHLVAVAILWRWPCCQFRLWIHYNTQRASAFSIRFHPIPRLLQAFFHKGAGCETIKNIQVPRSLVIAGLV